MNLAGVKELDFDVGIGTALPFKVRLTQFDGELTPRYEHKDGKVRGCVVDANGLYHWCSTLFESVEEFTEFMRPFKE